MYQNIARLGIEPLTVKGYQEVEDAYVLFQSLIRQGKLCVGRYENKSEKELQGWYEMVLKYIREKKMKEKPECSYAKFVQEKFPWIWKKYLAERN